MYSQLKHRDDDTEILGDEVHQISENGVIDRLLSTARATLKREFVEALYRGGLKFLRDHDLRVIVVTLHRAGCLIVGLPSSGTFWHEYVPGIPVSGREFNASAGDVFRGKLVAAVSYAQQKDMSSQQVMDQKFLREIGFLCNAAASIKVGSETFEKSTPQLRQQFSVWREAIFDK